MTMPRNIYTIAAGVPFARALAAELLLRTKSNPEKLAEYRILLPTRRACRVLREAFLRESDGMPLLLPTMQPLGDVEEDILSLETAALEPGLALDLPPAIPALRRQLLLARAVRLHFREKEGVDDMGAEHALRLAADLARLMDRTYTEGLDLSALPLLVSGSDFSAHWGRTLEFLEILSQVWPQILQSQGCIDGADRRNRLLSALAAHWEKNPPRTPVLAAGSTGSIPAAARLMKVVAGLPQGEIVLPGLDIGMDDESWAQIDDTHPQGTLRNLLNVLDIHRRDVRPWAEKNATQSIRAILARETMRPGATTAKWEKLGKKQDIVSESALRDLDLITAATPQEEAQVIALLLRETLEKPGQTASLVTPDRDLARRVAALMARYGVRMDDSAGTPLLQTKSALFMRLCAQAVARKLAPASLLSFLRHEMVSAGMDRQAMLRNIAALEVAVLRGPKPAPGIEGLKTRLQKYEERLKRTDESARAGIQIIANIFAPMLAVAAGGKSSFLSWLTAHLQTCELTAATENETGDVIIWAGDEGEMLAAFLSELHSEAAALDLSLPSMDAQEYLLTLEALMNGQTARTPTGLHPRLTILGQLEARLLQADLVIMGGLNEGTWPADPGHDTWMSRPMMRKFGLPPPERSIGLAAHDFVQGFCAPRVVMTRSLRRDGAPTVPARWLQRLETVLKAAGFEQEKITGRDWLVDLARLMDRPESVTPAQRPAPCPKTERRPRSLSVTEIETLLRDPYSIYARHVLRLRALDPIEKPPGADDRGNILHEIMQKFIGNTAKSFPDVARARQDLLDIGSDVIARRTDDPGFWEFWWPRFVRIADWAANEEAEWRLKAKPVLLEAQGEMKINMPGGEFKLRARADRIDSMTGSDSFAIMDYKSGGDHKAGKIKSGDAPQLPLEALILESGGFDGIPAGSKTSWLGYRVMKGGKEVAATYAVEGTDVAQTIDAAREGLPALISAYDSETAPYYSLPDPDRAPRYSDYEQLARVQEWAALGENDEGGANES